MKRIARRISATIADMGYLVLLPCRTAKTVNPFSVNGGYPWAIRRPISTLDCHPPLTIETTPAPLGCAGR
jgi:hypothetical protein